MANGSANLKPWPKGVSGNPGGKIKIPEELRNIKSLTQGEVTKLISKYARMLAEELEIAKQGKIAVLDLALISILEKTIDTGDYQRLAFLLERCCGKIPDVVEDEEDLEEREKLAAIPARELALLLLKTSEKPGEK